MANGPDGCLWVVDMCRELIEGAAFLPPQILKHMDVASGVDRGRIWRIVPEGHQPEHRPGWARRRRPSWSRCWSTPTAGTATRPRGCCTSGKTGRRSRPCGSSPPDSKQPVGRAHAFAALAGLGALEPGDVLAALGDPDPRVREHALRLAEPFCRTDERDSRPDDGRWPAIPTRWSATSSRSRWVRCRATGRRGTGRAGDPRRVRSLDADGDPQLGDGMHRRGLHRPGRRRRLPGLGAWPCLPDGPGRHRPALADRPDDLAAILAALDGPLAGEPALARGIVLALMDKDFARGAGPAGRQPGRTGPVDPRSPCWPTPARRPMDEGKSVAARRTAVRCAAVRRAAGSRGTAGRAPGPATAGGRAGGGHRDPGPLR